MVVVVVVVVIVVVVVAVVVVAVVAVAQWNNYLKKDILIQFSSARGGIFALGNIRMRSTLSLRIFPKCCRSRSSSFRLIGDDPNFSSLKVRQLSAAPF